MAKVKSSDEDGIYRAFVTFIIALRLGLTFCTILLLVSVGFFDDMWIPLNYLPQPSALYAYLHLVGSHILTPFNGLDQPVT